MEQGVVMMIVKRRVCGYHVLIDKKKKGRAETSDQLVQSSTRPRAYYLFLPLVSTSHSCGGNMQFTKRKITRAGVLNKHVNASFLQHPSPSSILCVRTLPGVDPWLQPSLRPQVAPHLQCNKHIAGRKTGNLTMTRHDPK